jgi:hypothetical protein
MFRFHRFVSALALLLGTALMAGPQQVQATAITDSTLILSNLLITPSTGSVVFADIWSTQAFAEANNSLGEADFDFASGQGLPPSSASATVTWAAGSGFASVDPLIASAATAINLPGFDNNAIALGQGSLSNLFMLAGGTGAVDVRFAMDVDGSLHGFADDVGRFSTEVIAALELDGSPLLFYSNMLSGGPNFPDTVVPVHQALSNTLSLEFGVPYFLFLQADSESFAQNVPEPGTLALTLLGLAGLAAIGAKSRKHKA